MESLSAQCSSASGSVATCGVRAPPHDGVRGCSARRCRAPSRLSAGVQVGMGLVVGCERARRASSAAVSSRRGLDSAQRSRQRAEVSGLRAVRTEVSDGLRPACAREGEVVDQKSAAAMVPQAFGRRVGRGTQGTEEGLL